MLASLAAGCGGSSGHEYRVPNDAMAPTLRNGDKITLDRTAYRSAPPAVGDIVVLHAPTGAARRPECAQRPPVDQACVVAIPGALSDVLYAKRVVAVAGDRISIRDGHVIRNGRRAAEPFITPCKPGLTVCALTRTFTVRGGLYVLGDNRGASDDSRRWGPIATASVIGRATRVG